MTDDQSQMTNDNIPGDYQYRALHHGHSVQRAWHMAKLDLIRRVAPPRRGGLVLDAGCGSGVIANFLAGRGAQVVGMDVNHQAVEFARQTFSRDNLEFVEVSIFDFQRGGFDMIYCLECIEHFPRGEVVRLLRHMRKIALPRGRLLLTTPNYRSAWPLIERFLDLFRLTPKLHGEQHISPLNPVLLRRDLGAAGWRLLEMGSFNGVAPFLAATSASVASFVGKWELRHRTMLHRNLIYALCG